MYVCFFYSATIIIYVYCPITQFSKMTLITKKKKKLSKMTLKLIITLLANKSYEKKRIVDKPTDISSFWIQQIHKKRKKKTKIYKK